MCTLVVLHRCFPEAPLLAAANRDEFLDRPAEAPAVRSWEGVRVLAPLDAQAGGTWLGINAQGLFVALTNRPAQQAHPAPRSRGLLVKELLVACGSAEHAAEALRALPGERYNPFNVLAADGLHAFVAMHRGDMQGGVQVLALAPGAHVVGNTDPDARAHPKTARILHRAEKVAAAAAKAAPGAPGAPPAQDALAELAELCRSHEGEGPLEATCIHAGGYGTRSSALLRLARRPEESRFLFASGAPCNTGYEDLTPLLTELAANARGARRETTERIVA